MSDCPTPVLLSLSLMADLTHKPVQSVHRWNTAAVKGARLPEPDVRVGNTPLWFEDTFLDYAERRGLLVDLQELERIRETQ